MKCIRYNANQNTVEPYEAKSKTVGDLIAWLSQFPLEWEVGKESDRTSAIWPLRFEQDLKVSHNGKCLVI